MHAFAQTVRRVDGRRRRPRRILDAAERVFAARGYAGATTREIADAAGIGKRMLFYYFATKDACTARSSSGSSRDGRIHEQFRTDPGPVGLAEAVEGITHFAAANLQAAPRADARDHGRGPAPARARREHLGPLFARGAAEVARNMDDGVFRPAIRCTCSSTSAGSRSTTS